MNRDEYCLRINKERYEKWIEEIEGKLEWIRIIYNNLKESKYKYMSEVSKMEYIEELFDRYIRYSKHLDKLYSVLNKLK